MHEDMGVCNDMSRTLPPLTRGKHSKISVPNLGRHFLPGSSRNSAPSPAVPTGSTTSPQQDWGRWHLSFPHCLKRLRDTAREWSRPGPCGWHPRGCLESGTGETNSPAVVYGIWQEECPSVLPLCSPRDWPCPAGHREGDADSEIQQLAENDK